LTNNVDPIYGCRPLAAAQPWAPKFLFFSSPPPPPVFYLMLSFVTTVSIALIINGIAWQFLCIAFALNCLALAVLGITIA